MRARIAWGIAGIAVVIGALVYHATRPGGRDDAPRTSEESASPAAGARDAGSTPGRARRFPRPVIRTGSREASIDPSEDEGEAIGFAAEARDEAWAAAREAELRARLASVPAQVEVECRQRTCRVSLATADEPSLGAALARLESDDGLRGVAAQLVIGEVVPAEDDAVRVDTFVEIR